MRTMFMVSVTLFVTAVLLTGCGQNSKSDDPKVIKFASHNFKVYEDTTKVLAKEVEKLGYKLEPVFLADNTQLNEAVENGEYFANYHQHAAYLEGFNAAHKSHLVQAFPVFTDRGGIFSKKHKNLKDLPEGASITIDNNPGNHFRGLVILQDAGLIKLKEGVSFQDISQKDVVENPKKLKFIEVDYTLLARGLDDADAGFLYATVATEFGLDINKDALGVERTELQSPDIIAVRSENLNSEKTEILKKAYYSDAVKQALKDAFGGKEVLQPAW